MVSDSFWSRLREARAVQGLLVFLGFSWLILQLLDIFIDNLGLPAWTMVGAVVLLTIGLVVQLAVVWVQALHLAIRDDTVERGLAAGDADAPPPSMEKERSTKLPSFTWARFALGGTFAFAILFGISGAYVIFVSSAEGRSPVGEPLDSGAAPAVAVLPFSVSGTQLEEIGDGLVNLLATNLDGVAGLRAIDSRTVLARWDELVGGRGRADQPTNLAVARATGARYALLGSAVAVGPDVRLQADIYDVSTGERLEQRQIQGAPDSVLTLVDRLSVEVMDVILGQTGDPMPSRSLASMTTRSIPALKEFLSGEVAYRRADFETARASYERAVADDSTFALAYYQLANTWGWTDGPGHPEAIENRHKAAGLGNRLPERQALLVQATDELFRGEMSAIDKLREVVEKYPDHAEAWYLLGDAYFHLGPRSMATPAEIDQAFAQAVELDPRFAAFHIHLLDLSFPLRDSVRAATRIARYRELAAGGRFERRAQLQFDLAYGDAGTQEGARAELENMGADDLRMTASAYLNACCWHAKEVVLEELRGRDDVGATQFAIRQLANGAMSHGQVEKALTLFEDSAIYPGNRVCTLSAYALIGFPLPEAELDRTLAIGELGENEGAGPLCRGLYAGQRGRWGEFDRVVDYYDSLPPAAKSEELLGGPPDPATMATALRGFRLWKLGQPEAALPLVEEAFRAGVYGWWLGDIYEELGRLEAAARFYEAQYLFPLAYFRLGEIYEQLGEPEKARFAYETFVVAWDEADASVRSRVEEAIEGILRTSDRRGP